MQEFDGPELIYGVDYSASKRDAGRNTWIAKCDPIDDDKLVVECLADAATFLNCKPKRDATNRALVECIDDGTEKARAFGLDFPFGLPSNLLEEEDDWRTFLAGVPDRWGALAQVSDPTTLYETAREYVDAGAHRLLRMTDEEHGGQEPTGFRIKTQTYYGITKVLERISDDVSVFPMDEPEEGTVVVETYPAAVFRGLRDDEVLDREVFATGYKRDTQDAIDRRKANVEALDEAGVEIGEYCKYAIATDDALDAVAAAYATWQATVKMGYSEDLGGKGDEISDRYRREGYIFA